MGGGGQGVGGMGAVQSEERFCYCSTLFVKCLPNPYILIAVFIEKLSEMYVHLADFLQTFFKRETVV